MPNETCSVISLRDSRGLINSLMEKMCGRKGQFWLNATKRFLRRDDPFIRSKKIHEVSSTAFFNTKRALDQLEALNVAIIGGIRQHLERVMNEPLQTIDDVPFSSKYFIVEVLVGDLLTDDEMLSFDYQQLLDKAREEFGLETCGVADGIAVAEILVQKERQSGQGSYCKEYIVCCKPFNTGDGKTRLPNIAIWPGKRSSARMGAQGSVCLLDVESRSVAPKGSYPPRHMENPETRLLFRLIV